MDILAIRGKTVSAVICQLQWRELSQKIENWMLRSIFNFCFWTKNWSIDHALSDKSTRVEECSAEVPSRGWGSLEGGGVRGLVLVQATCYLIRVTRVSLKQRRHLELQIEHYGDGGQGWVPSFLFVWNAALKLRNAQPPLLKVEKWHLSFCFLELYISFY